MRFLSLFAGIGGFDLGLERAGWKCVGQVEIDPYCRAVLVKHWPDVPRMEDVRDVQGHEFGPVDAVVGGFPCQPHSVAGKRLGTADERHLWPEYARIIRAIRPRWVVAENVPGLRTTAADEVIGDLEEAGYAVWPCVVGAWAVGAPHRRDRVWIVADATAGGSRAGTGLRGDGQSRRGRKPAGCGEVVADASLAGLEERRERSCGTVPQLAVSTRGGGHLWPSRPGEPQHEWEAPRLAYSSSDGLSGRAVPVHERRQGQPDADAKRSGERMEGWQERCGQWSSQPRLGDAVDGLPRRVADSGVSHGQTSRHISEEAMRLLQEADPAAFGRGPVHGSTADVLQSRLYGQWVEGKGYTGEINAVAAGKSVGAEEGQVRTVRGDGAAGTSPQGQEPCQQRFGQRSDPLQKLSRKTAWTPARLRREALKALGNSIVPQVAEAIGRAILEVDRSMA